MRLMIAINGSMLFCIKGNGNCITRKDGVMNQTVFSKGVIIMPRHTTISTPIELQKYLKNVAYPARKGDLEKAARNNGAKENILELIKELPDEEYDAPPAVMQAFGELNR
jgi:hypothetical protein